MFNKEHQEINVKKAETIIGPSIRVRGNFYGQGNIIIDGQIDGSVKTDSYLLVGEKAKINANVEAKDAKIGGKITGNVKIGNYLEVDSTAQISGDIEAASISVEKGAVLNGKCTMTMDKSSKNNHKT